MRVAVVTHADPDSTTGNSVTARRWANVIRSLGHDVELGNDFLPATEVLLAIHATHTADPISRFKRRFPGRCVVLALSGTDIYRDWPDSRSARRSIELADYLIALQSRAVDRLPASLRKKCRVIHQSARRPGKLPDKLASCFEVSVSAHLRAVKDPFRTVDSALLLPKSSRVRVSQIGCALNPQMDRQARSYARQTTRYHWFGGQPAWRARWLVARSRLLVNSSLMEGGANVVSEAMMAGVPVVASDVDGNIGMLGADYPGYFPVGDTRALADLLLRVEREEAFHKRLKLACRQRARLFSRQNEIEAWRNLLTHISAGAS